jgi:hypothetical protein
MLAFIACITIHNIFHFSFLKKYIHDANNLIDWNVIQVEKQGALQSASSAHTRPKNQASMESIHKDFKGLVDIL